MQLGIAISTFETAFGPIMFSGDLLDKIPRIAELGYHAVDLFIRTADEPGIDTVCERLRSCGLQVALLAAVSAFVDDGLALSSRRLSERRAMLARMGDQIRLASQLGAKVPIGLLRGRLGGLESEKYLAESLFQLLEVSKPLGVELVIEPVNRCETTLINRLDEAITFLQRFDLPPLPLLPDVFHMNVEEASIYGALRFANGRIRHVHLADSNRRVPGKGHIHWEQVFAGLEDAAFDGTCSIEAFPGDDPWLDALEAVHFLKKYMRLHTWSH